MLAERNLFGLSRLELRELAAGLGEPAYRADQIYVWLYRRRTVSLSAMSNLPRSLRERLASAYGLRWPEVAERSRSADGTVKYLFRLDDGAEIESVYIPEPK